MKRFRMDITGNESEKEDEDTTTNTLFDNTNINRTENNDAFEAFMTNSLNLQQTPKITQDQQNRMVENKRKAEEKRKSRMLNIAQSHLETHSIDDSTTVLSHANLSELDETLKSPENDNEILDVDTFLEHLPQTNHEI